MAVQKILMPMNFSEMDRKALSFVLRTFSHQEGVHVSLFHIYTPIPEIDTPSGTVMGRLSSSMQFLSSQLREKEEALKENQVYLISNGFNDDQVDYIFRSRVKQVADEIIDTVKNEGFDIVVLSCKSSRITRLFIQSVHQKVIVSLANVTICIVT